MCRLIALLLMLPLLAAALGNSAQAAIGGPSRDHQATTTLKSSMPIPEIPGLGPQPPVRAVKWDYFEYPVNSSSPSSRKDDFVFGTIPIFDGYPERVDQPSIRIYWNCDAPKPGAPVHVDIDYLQPVAVTRFVHYFDRVPRDSAAAKAMVYWQGWQDAEVLCSTDNVNWTPLEAITLERDYPQVIGIRNPTAARYYRVVVKSMLENVDKLHSYELETWFGATVANVVPSVAPVQSETLNLNVRVHSLDAALKGGTLKVTSPEGWLLAPETKVPAIDKGSADVAIAVTPLVSGDIPVIITLTAENGGKTFEIDKRPYTLRVAPKLQLTEITPEGATSAEEAIPSLTLTAKVTNNGLTAAANAQAAWLGAKQGLGTLAPGQTASITLTATPAAGYQEGTFEVTADNKARSFARRSVLTPLQGTFSIQTDKLITDYSMSVNEPAMTTTFKDSGKTISGFLMIFSETGGQLSLKQVGTPESPLLAGAMPHSVMLVKPGLRAEGGEDQEFDIKLIPNDPHDLTYRKERLTVRFKVNNVMKMFRPHMDLFNVGEDPKFGWGGWAFLSPTRMHAVQTAAGTVSMVPSTDNYVMSFETDQSLNATFDCDLPDPDPLGLGIWQPIGKSPREFKVTMPIREGDWWDAYQHVVERIFNFEQARQWAMPITQMQMLNARQMMREENWSDQFKTMRSFPNSDVFYNFYGTTYSIPAMYQWYLATDDVVALQKAQGIVKWLIGRQNADGPMAGTWFSQYNGDRGEDQAGNRWLLPHSTGTSAKTLLWYYEASGKQDADALAAARRGCDFLVTHQMPNGAWPYAFDLDGKVISEASDAGQIWCSWALWKMWQFTGEQKYLDSALKYKVFFIENCFKPHRYSGYWEDVSAAGGDTNPAARSTETYEAAIATQYFIEMGDPELAKEIAKDSALTHWTRVTSTRSYETQYGQTVEQGSGGPSQAQSPMSAISAQRVCELTGDPFWSKLAGAVKGINFCAEPELGYGMVAIAGWDSNLEGVISPPYDNSNPLTAPGFGLGRGVWNEWQSAQFTWLALEWLIREGNIRAPQHIKIDPLTLRGSVLGKPGRVLMPQDRVDVTPIEHIDVNWTGYRNDDDYVLQVMNHQEKTGVYLRPHEAHLDIYTLAPRVLVAEHGGEYKELPVEKRGVQYYVELPAQGTALFIWKRIR